ncbi:MAG TPA: hypothetical protein VJM09_08055 [Sphingobium sp.]|nr:hypothetical protein [Sphingobium sp.]
MTYNLGTDKSIAALLRQVGIGGCSTAMLLALGATCVSAAQAQESSQATAADDTHEGEIVVTAQKRAQSINSVPMSITAATGAELVNRGITETSDLVKITAGLTFAQSQAGTPVYTLRGIGYDGQSVAARHPSIRTKRRSRSRPKPVAPSSISSASRC